MDFDNSSYSQLFSTTAAGKSSTVDSIMNRILDGILTGEYKAGDKLPTEAQLTEMFGVSKNTLREAIKILVAYGVVEIRRPEGTFIASGLNPKMLSPIIYSTLISGAASEDITGLRRVIDMGVCLLIMQRGLSDEHRLELERNYADYEKLCRAEDPDVAAIVEKDNAFHRVLARATENELVRTLHDFVLDLTIPSRHRAIELSKAENNMEYLCQSHRMTLDMVAGKSDTSLEEMIDFTYIYWKRATTGK